MCPSQIRTVCLALMAAALGCSPASAHERPITAPAARFLEGTIETAFGLVRPPVTPQANTTLEALIRDSMDWPGLAQFAIGRYRADLKDGEMGGVTARLEQQLGALARRAGVELPTMTLAIHDMRIDPDGNRHVLSTATLPRFGEIEVEWTLAPAAKGYRIADIAAFGLTLRQFLRNWIATQVAAQGGDAGATFAAPASPE
jgi:hypothetical protein